MNEYGELVEIWLAKTIVLGGNGCLSTALLTVSPKWTCWGLSQGPSSEGANDWLPQPWPGSTAAYLKVFLHTNDYCVYILPLCPTW
jgi:hypothetical protein